MSRYRLKVWTGPTYAKEMGRMVRRVGLPVTTGTEHIHVDVKGTSCAGATHNMLAQIYRKYRTDFGLRVQECWERERTPTGWQRSRP